MRITGALSVLLLLGTSSAAVLERASKCNADNCLRAVRATAASPGASAASADCNAILYTFVQPCPTSAPYSAPTTTQPPTSSPPATTATAACPSSSTYTFLPNYVSSACGNDFNRYRSACNCVGATGTTVTYPAQATLVTTTTTVQPSSTACASEFILVPTTEKYKDQFLSTDGILIDSLNHELVYATKFFLDRDAGTANVSLSRYNGQQGNGNALVSKNDPFSYVFQDYPNTDELYPLACSITPDGSLPNSGKFSCHQRANASISTFQISTQYNPGENIDIGYGLAGPSFELIEFRAVPVC